MTNLSEKVISMTISEESALQEISEMNVEVKSSGELEDAYLTTGSPYVIGDYVDHAGRDALKDNNLSKIKELISVIKKKPSQWLKLMQWAEVKAGGRHLTGNAGEDVWKDFSKFLKQCDREH